MAEFLNSMADLGTWAYHNPIIAGGAAAIIAAAVAAIINKVRRLLCRF